MPSIDTSEMSSTFSGFSEDDLKRIKLGAVDSDSVPKINTSNVRKIEKIGAKPKRPTYQYKLPILQKQGSDDSIENMFDKCKLSIKTPTSPPSDSLNNFNDTDAIEQNNNNEEKSTAECIEIEVNGSNDKDSNESVMEEDRKNRTDTQPNIVRCFDNYTEDEMTAHKEKLADLQLRQKLMEEQNKKRKEMLAKALADRTKQTAEEVQRLEKIKKELQILDGQFSQDVSVLRKKIDQACLTYSEAEKHYLRIEKEFLQAKISLQKEKEKKELLTEHLCALITHNETRKAQKLETLMLELASDKKSEVNEKRWNVNEKSLNVNDKSAMEDEDPNIVDGVDQKTGKIVEFS